MILKLIIDQVISALMMIQTLNWQTYSLFIVGIKVRITLVLHLRASHDGIRTAK